MNRRLTLATETLKRLDTADAAYVEGGRIPLTRTACAGECIQYTNTCVTNQTRLFTDLC
jgi:hypothetical protein